MAQTNTELIAVMSYWDSFEAAIACSAFFKTWLTHWLLQFQMYNEPVNGPYTLVLQGIY